MTPAQTWVTRVKRTLGSDTPCGSIDSLVSLVKEGRLYCGNVEMSEQGLRDAARMDDEDREERKADSRRLVSPVRKEGYPKWPQPQQQHLVASHGGRHEQHHRNRSVAAGNGVGGMDGREGMDGHSWAAVSRVRSSSHGSYHMQGGEPPHESGGLPREHQGNRSPPDVLSSWQCPRAERLPGGGNGGGGSEGDADLYPVYSKRKKLCRDDASWARRGSKESNIHAAEDGGGSYSASGNGWSQESYLMSARAPGAGTTDPHEQQSRRQPPPYAISRRGDTNGHEYAQEHHRQEITTTTGGAQAEETSVRRREHGLLRGIAAPGKTYPAGPTPLYEPFEQQREATGSNSRGGGDNGGREATNDRDGSSAGHAAVGRRPFRLKPAPLPPHMHMDNRQEAFFPGYDQAAGTTGSEAGQQYRPEVPYRASPSGVSPQQQQQQRSSEGHDHDYAAKEERRAWGNDAASELQHRPAKAPRMRGVFSHRSNGGGSTHHGRDDNSDYPMYREQQQQRSRRAATTTANSNDPQYRRDGDSSTGASAAEKSYHRMSPKSPAERYSEGYSSFAGAPPPRASSRDHGFDVSTSPRSMGMSSGRDGGSAVVVPSNEYGTVVVGPGGRNGHALEHCEAPPSRWGGAVRRDAEREVVNRARAPLAHHPATKTVLVGKDYYY